MNSQSPVINVSGDYEETILRLAKHLGRDKNRRNVFNLIYGRGSKFRSKKQIAEALGKPGNAQVIQNALDELARHHLIVKVKNEGHVADRSRWVYGKDTSVRANRAQIIKFADAPGEANKVATKRRPAQPAFSFVKPKSGGSKALSRTKRHVSIKAKLKIALLVTNPDSKESLQTGIEARYIDEGIRMASRGSDVDLKIVLAPTLDSLIDTLNSYSPDVLHFSGHGGSQSLLFDNDKAGDDGGKVLDFDMIARVVEATSADIKLLVLAACDTLRGADRFLEAVPVVIAMSDSINDDAACEFSRRFYSSVSSGATISNALKQAKIVLESKGYSDADLPTIIESALNYSENALL